MSSFLDLSFFIIRTFRNTPRCLATLQRYIFPNNYNNLFDQSAKQQRVSKHNNIIETETQIKEKKFLESFHEHSSAKTQGLLNHLSF